MGHVDLLFGARRLWRLALERCRLQDLESKILGVERVGDVGGGFIPELYFEWLRTGNGKPLEPVFRHNATDILSLACLTAVAPMAMRDPARLKSGAEMVGVARWLRNEGKLEEALALMRGALRRRMEEPLVYETLWQAGEIERKLGRVEEAAALWSELAAVRNPWQAQALERLAIHYEHAKKDAAKALEMTRAALALGESAELRKREERLARKASAPKPGRLIEDAN
jgi:tetratricopeptide (TPR) repeat protein